MTQESLAFLARLHPTYISMLENGRKSPTVDVLEKLARALHVKPSTILASAERSANGLGSDG
jgi:transcriptional regulator with XRE-family HTH domain